MARRRVGVLAVLALAIFLASVGTASAVFELTLSGGVDVECTPKIPTVCEAEGGKNLELEGEEGFTIGLNGAGETLLEAIFGTEVVHITCTIVEGTGTLVQATPLTTAAAIKGLVIGFLGCALLEPLAKKCKVPEHLETVAIKGSFVDKDPVEEITFEPETGTTFIEIEFANSTETCPATIKGLKKVTGTQKCKIESPEVAGTEHEISCLEGGSGLKLGENTAQFKLPALIKLKTFAGSWAIDLG
jgi:hypothetical protein